MRANAVGGDTYWVTVAQSVGVVVLFVGGGVVAGVLLRWKLWRQAVEDAAIIRAERLRQQAGGGEAPAGGATEAIVNGSGALQQQPAERPRNRPIRAAGPADDSST